MLHFGAEVAFRRLNQIQKPALWCLWKHSALAGLHGTPELSLTDLEVVSFLDADEACIPMEPLSGCVQLMHVAQCSQQSGPAADAASTPMWQRIPKNHCLPLAHRVHFRIPLLGLVFGGAGGIDDRCIKDRAFPLHHSPLAQNLVHTLCDLLGDAVIFQQMAEVEDRGLIRDPPFHRLDSGEAAEAGRIYQHLLHQWI
jgi:hypothetical protein